MESEIARPLGAEFYWGINASLHARVVPMVGDALGWALLHVVRVLGLYTLGALPEAPQNLTAIVAELLRGVTGGGVPIAMRISNGLSPFSFVVRRVSVQSIVRVCGCFLRTRTGYTQHIVFAVARVAIFQRHHQRAIAGPHWHAFGWTDKIVIGEGAPRCHGGCAGAAV